MKTLSERPNALHKKLILNANTNIIRLHAESNYTTFILLNGKPQTMCYTIGLFHAVLPTSFIKVSRSCIVNRYFIKNVNYCEQSITLADNTEIQIARRVWSDFRKNISTINS